MDYHDSLSAPSFAHGLFNRRIDPRHLDFAEDDTSCFAGMIRRMAHFVSSIFRPRQVIVLLRLLKAFTFCTLGMGVIADLVFIFLVQINVSDEVNIKLGGIRDIVCRLYGVAIAILVITIELNMDVSNSNFAVLKPFIPRSLLLLLVAALSATSPMINHDEDLVAVYDNIPIKDEVPVGAFAFQAMTSFILCFCAGAYFVLGFLCIDRFTPAAFLADKDQIVATVNATAVNATPVKTTIVSNSIFSNFTKFTNTDAPAGAGGNVIEDQGSFDSYIPPYRVRQHSYSQFTRYSDDSFDSVNRLMTMVHGTMVD